MIPCNLQSDTPPRMALARIAWALMHIPVKVHYLVMYNMKHRRSSGLYS